MKQKARVTRGPFPCPKRSLTPLPLDDQDIIVILIARRQPAELFAGDIEHAILDAEDVLRVVIFTIVQIGIESAQVLAIELEDGLAVRTFGTSRA